MPKSLTDYGWNTAGIRRTVAKIPLPFAFPTFCQREPTGASLGERKNPTTSHVMFKITVPMEIVGGHQSAKYKT
jgi:hypothetical protein